jgi:hypothetical protein
MDYVVVVLVGCTVLSSYVDGDVITHEEDERPSFTSSPPDFRFFLIIRRLRWKRVKIATATLYIAPPTSPLLR